MTVADLYAKLSLKTNKASFDAGDRLIGGIKKAVVALGAYMSIKWAAGLVQQTTEVASRFVDLSAQIGVAIEPLQQLGYAASQSGSNLDGLAIGMKKFSMTAQDARDGTEQSIETMRRLGVDTKKLLDGTLPLDAALMQVADTFQAMPDGPAKAALAARAFGKAGGTLIPMLNEGSAGIAKMRQEFIDLGGQIDEKTARQLEGFGDETDKVKIVFAGLRNTVVKALVPAFLELTKTFLAWFKANRAEITRKLERAMHSLANVLRQVGRVISYLMELTDDLKGAFEVVAVVIASLGLAMLAPFALTAALIAGVILLVQDLWTWFAKGSEHSVFGQLYEYMVEGLADTIEKWMSKIEGFFEWAKEKKNKFLGKDQNNLLLGGIETWRASGSKERIAGGQTDQERARAEQAKEDDRSVISKAGDYIPFNAGVQFVKRLVTSEDTNLIPGRYVDRARASGVQVGSINVNATVPEGMANKEGAGLIGRAVREALESASRDLAAGTGAVD